MLRATWQSYTIQTTQDMQHAFELIQSIDSDVGGFDTETSGLNIKLDHPFLFVCGLIDRSRKNGLTFAVDLEQHPELGREFILKWYEIAETFTFYFAHNVKYDLHMMNNINLRYTAPNVSDTQFFIRYACDAIPERFGGPPLALKKFATQYIDRKAGQYEKKVLLERGKIAKEYNLDLKQRLRECPPPENTRAKSWTLGVLEDLFKDQVLEPDELPRAIRAQYKRWLADLPIWLQTRVHGLVDSDSIPYNRVPREVVTEYAHYDVIYMLEIFIYLEPILNERDNWLGVEIENQLIYPLIRMESVGFKINVPYLKESRLALKRYILERRKRLYQIAGRVFKLGQREVILDVFLEKFDIEIATTATESFDILHAELITAGDTTGAIEFIEVIQELRTLEKWYAVYLLRFLQMVDKNDMLYTQLHQVGAVSGRFSSDFQQFPKGTINDINGNELFNPRKIVMVENPDEEFMAFMDYSQIELRFQAIYTILCGNPDLNLCRAYMPYECWHEDGHKFNPENPDDLARWKEHWFEDEAHTIPWVPTDVHGVTTTKATGLTPEDDGFKAARGAIGKRLNFAKNYGAGRGKVRIMFPDATEEEIDKINNAYYEAYPGIKTYHDYCYRRAEEHSHTANLFGIKYYNATGHKLINLLVQGSAAYLLKLKIIEIDRYIQEHKLRTRIQMQIHDELMFRWKEAESQYLRPINQLMGQWDDTLIPIEADCEYAPEHWAEKRKVEFVA